MSSRHHSKAHRRHHEIDLSRLPLTVESDEDAFQVVIETPKDSRNKYAYDAEAGVFRLRKVLPAGMAFPYDFGFLPSTLAEDGDPVDVLVLMDQAAFPGCVLSCRLIGAILGEQQEAKGKPVRNDRLVAIETLNHSYCAVRRISDLGKHFLEELEAFFVDYHDISSEKFKVLSVVGPGKARKLAKAFRV
jgi:inorganic pyrophosphatase